MSRLYFFLFLTFFACCSDANEKKGELAIGNIYGVSESDKIFLNNRKIKMTVELLKHQSKSADFLDIGLRIFNDSASDLSVTGFAESCQILVVAPNGEIITVDQNLASLLANAPGPEPHREKEWVKVGSGINSFVPILIKNPLLKIGQKNTNLGVYKIWLYCGLELKLDSEINITFKSNEMEFDYFNTKANQRSFNKPK